MSMIEKYGIKPGQRYFSADGTDPAVYHVVVVDTTEFAFCDDVLVQSVENGVVKGEPRRIDAWKLAMCRYYREEE